MIKSIKSLMDEIKSNLEIKKVAAFSILFFLISIIIYSFFINNQLVNTRDGLWNGQVFLAGKWEVSLGRFALPLLTLIRFGICAEPFHSILSLAMISFGIVLIFDLFDLLNIKGIVLFLLIIIHPTYLNILSYRYFAIENSLSILSSILGAVVLIKFHNSNLKMEILSIMISVIFFVGTLSIYQSFISFASFVIVLYTISLLLNEKSIKEAISLIIKFAISILIACILYRILWKLVLVIINIKESSYGGANDLDIISMLLNVPQKIVDSYRLLLAYLFTDNIIIHNAFKLYFVEVLLVLISLVTIIIRFFSKKNKKDDILIKLFFLMLLLILPLTLCTQIFFINRSGINEPSSASYTIFTPLLIGLCFNNNINDYLLRKKIIKISSVILLGLMLYSNIFQYQIDILTMWEGRNSCVSIMNSIINRLDKKDLYDENCQYVFLGTPYKNSLYKVSYNNYGKLDGLLRANDYAKIGQFWEATDTLYMSYSGFLKNVMGNNMNIVLKDYEYYDYLKTDEEYLRLKPFPSDDCMMVFDIEDNKKVVIVKISD